MANVGKFTDRNPKILAAGVSSKLSDFPPCLKYHTLEEEVEAILPERQRRDPPIYAMPSANIGNYVGYYTQVKSLVSPPRGTALKEMLDELRLRAPSQGLPHDMDPLNTTFGKPTVMNKEGESADEVVLPKIPYGETKLTEQLGLELYQKSHNRYLVGQRRDLKYDAPTNVTYGKIHYLDRTGILAKKSLKWFNQESVARTSKGQARVRERSHFEIGKALSPNNILETVGDGKVFGISTGLDDTGVREGMREGPVDKRKQINGEYIGFICSMRQAIKRKEPPFPFFDLVTNLKLLDQEGCGCLPLELVYKVCERLGLYFDKELFELVLRYLNVLHGENNDTISYHGFCNILDFRKPLPEFKKVDETVERAGVPTLREDRSMPGEGTCRGDTFLLADETTVDSCIRPSIFSSYGLTPRDFLQPRTKEFIKDLWNKVGLDIPDNIFEEMWKEGLTREENDGKTVCIESFRNMLDEMCEVKLVEVRES